MRYKSKEHAKQVLDDLFNNFCSQRHEITGTSHKLNQMEVELMQGMEDYIRQFKETYTWERKR